MEKCECKVILDAGNTSGESGAFRKDKIILCSKHNAVDELLDACKAAVAILETPMVRGIFSNTDALELCEEAIAKAEGR